MPTQPRRLPALAAFAAAAFLSSCSTILHPGLADHGNPGLPPYDFSGEKRTQLAAAAGGGSSTSGSIIPFLALPLTADFMEGGALLQWRGGPGKLCGDLALGASAGIAGGTDDDEVAIYGPVESRTFAGVTGGLRLGFEAGRTQDWRNFPSAFFTWNYESGPYFATRAALAEETAPTPDGTGLYSPYINMNDSRISWSFGLTPLDICFPAGDVRLRLGGDLGWSSFWWSAMQTTIHSESWLSLTRDEQTQSLIAWSFPSTIGLRLSCTFPHSPVYASLAAGYSSLSVMYPFWSFDAGIGLAL